VGVLPECATSGGEGHQTSCEDTAGESRAYHCIG
jgi:hypothetical protein